MDQCEGKVLEEEETQKLAHSDVGPTSVHQQEALQVTELSKGVVAGHDGLHPLLTTDTNTDVCSWRDRGRVDRLEQVQWNICHVSFNIRRISLVLTLDHVDVVGSISDRQRHGFLVLLHQTHHVSLLLGCDTAADDCLALTGHVHKVNLWRHFTPFVIM